jgi:hypothetical protein
LDPTEEIEWRAYFLSLQAESKSAGLDARALEEAEAGRLAESLKPAAGADPSGGPGYSEEQLALTRRHPSVFSDRVSAFHARVPAFRAWPVVPAFHAWPVHRCSWRPFLNPLSDCSKPGLPKSTNPYPISPDPEFLDPGLSFSDITLFHVSSSSSRHAPART